MTTKFFLTLMSHASLCFLLAHSLDCSENGIEKAIVKCLKGSGLDSSIGLIAIMMSDPTDICRNISVSKEAIGCTSHVGQRCVSEDMKPYVPEPATVQSSVESLCDSLTAIHSSCQQSAVTDLTDCFGRKMENQMMRDAIDLACYFFQANSECVAELLPKCGCSTTNIYVQMFKQLNPSACEPYKVAIPGCEPDAKHYSRSGNLQRMPLLSWLTLVLYSLCAAN